MKENTAKNLLNDEISQKDTWGDIAGNTTELPSEKDLHAGVDALKETKPLADVPLEELLNLVDEGLSEQKTEFKPVNPHVEEANRAKRLEDISKAIEETIENTDAAVIAKVIAKLPDSQKEADLKKIREINPRVANEVEQALESMDKAA